MVDKSKALSYIFRHRFFDVRETSIVVKNIIFYVPWQFEQMTSAKRRREYCMNIVRGDASTNSQRKYLYIAWRVFLCVCTLFVDEKCVFKTLGHLINAIKVKV